MTAETTSQKTELRLILERQKSESGVVEKILHRIQGLEDTEAQQKSKLAAARTELGELGDQKHSKLTEIAALERQLLVLRRETESLADAAEIESEQLKGTHNKVEDLQTCEHELEARHRELEQMIEQSRADLTACQEEKKQLLKQVEDLR